MTTTKETIESVAADLGLSMTAEFVPFSRSRNKGEKSPSLNWLVTILRNGREVLTTDYGAGCGYCPAYKADIKTMGGANSLMRTDAIRQECESGLPALAHSSGDVYTNRSGKPIMPDFADVLHSLVSDSDVIDFRTFEDWASAFDCDVDSRKAEATYRACLDIALKLRNAIGEQGLATLREACQDY